MLSFLGRGFPIGYVSCCIMVYLACILHVSCRIHVSWVYLDVSQMYLKCSVKFQETYMYLDIFFGCILHVSQTSPRYISDTHKIHQDTCILCASLMSLWIHIRIHQDTCILDSSSRYIKIHRDTKIKIKIHVGTYLGRVMMTLQDTIRIHKGYIWDTCGIHAGLLRSGCADPFPARGT